MDREKELADLGADQEREALRLRDLHEVPLNRDRGPRALHVSDLNGDDLGRKLRLHLRCVVSSGCDRCGDGKGGDDGSDGGDALGTSRATVNRVLREEEKVGAVALARGRTTLVDRATLESRCRRN
jgi:hypothetical protein